MRFLDVAAGSGALSIPAARLGAKVLATDQSTAMLSRLEARARSEGLDIEVRVMDGHALALGDDSFDMAGSQFGVMLFPDMPRGIREMARALQAVRPDFHGLPTDPPPLPLQLQDPERVRRELTAAGLHDVTVATITERLAFPTGQSLWDWLVSSNPIVETVLGSLALSREERAVVRQALAERVHERAAGGGVARLTNPINIGIGTK